MESEQGEPRKSPTCHRCEDKNHVPSFVPATVPKVEEEPLAIAGAEWHYNAGDNGVRLTRKQRKNLNHRTQALYAVLMLE